MRKNGIGVAFGILVFLWAWSALGASDREGSLRMAAVKIKVSDMGRAIEFYSGKIGFPVASMRHFPQMVALENETIPLWLEAARLPAPPDLQRTVRTGSGFQAVNLAETIRNLQSKEVEFLNDTPQKVGVGISNYFRDPFGNILYYLEQQVGEPASFREPRIYNAGQSVPDLAEARRFYCDGLGFVVRSERYLPALPLGHSDGSFAFMLHERKDLSQSNLKYPDQAQTLIVLQAGDLDLALERAVKAGGKVVSRPRSPPLGRTAAIRDPFGNVLEVVDASR